MNVQAIVTLLNTGNTTEALTEAREALTRCTVAQLRTINADPALICHAYKPGKARMIADMVAGIEASLRSDAILRMGGPRW